MSEGLNENENKDCENAPLDEIENNENLELEEQSYICPRCKSTNIEDWGDGNLICNNCDKLFIDF